MSAPFNALTTRVSTLEARVSANEDRIVYPARARQRDEQIVEAVDRSACVWVGVPLGTICAGRTIVSTGTHTFATYATGGVTVSIPTLPSPVDVVMAAVTAGGAVYTFLWNGTSKMLVYTGGAEVADLTDISAIGAHRYMVYGAGRDDSEVYRARGSVKLLKATFVAAAAFTADSSNYWDVTLRHRSGTQTTGETVGSAYSLANVGLTALDPVTLYDDQRGLAMTEGERLALYVEQTGTPSPLEDLVLWLLVQRIVR